eukprot:scaffold94093_cov60-Phaeocystis_antarctica.AAC.1
MSASTEPNLVRRRLEDAELRALLLAAAADAHPPLATVGEGAHRVAVPRVDARRHQDGWAAVGPVGQAIVRRLG